MFFKFCSNKDYGQAYWCVIWDIEKAIQALILTDVNSVRTSSDNEIKEEIINLLSIDNQQAYSNFISLYLDQEIPCVRDYIRALFNGDDTATISKQIRKENLMPTNMLDFCIKTSNEFRAYVSR